MGRPHWVPPDNPEFSAWNVPLGEMFAVDVDCANRSGTRHATSTETPWAIAFESDGGSERVYDQTSATVQMGDAMFDVFVNNAVASDDTRLGHDPTYNRIGFVIVREPG